MSLTEADQKYLIKALECLEEPMKVDYEKLAQLTGVGSSKSAGNGFRIALKKIKDGGLWTKKANNHDGAPATPGPGKKRARKSADDPDEAVVEPNALATPPNGEAAGEEDGSPSKKARKPRAKKAPELDADGNVVTPKRVRKTKAAADGDGDLEATPTKPKTARKPKASANTKDEDLVAEEERKAVAKEAKDAADDAQFDKIDAVLEGAKVGKAKGHAKADTKLENGYVHIETAHVPSKPSEDAAMTSLEA